LLTNAIQSISDQTKAKIEVWVFDGEKEVVLVVKDNGVGILKEDFNKIFEPKFTTKSSGMGLGLAMVKNIVESYNGQISFESIRQKGSTFTVTLPKE
jgi:signal transduction histidine kinase